MDHLDVFEWYLKRIGRDLCPARRVALPLRGGAGEHGDFAVRGDPYAAELPWPETANLHVARESDTEKLRGRILPSLRLFLPNTIIVDMPQELVERASVIAAVIGKPCRGLVREPIRSDEVAAAKLDRIERELVREQVHRAFEKISGLRTACATIRLAHSFVGEHTRGARADVRDVIDTRHHHARERGNDWRHAAEIGAAIPS